MRARYYAPSIARFINQDTLLGDINPGVTLNRYSFSNDDPINNLDPEGRFGRNSKDYVYDKIYPDAASAQSSVNIQKRILGDQLYNNWVSRRNNPVEEFYTRLNQAADNGMELDADAETRRTDALC